MKNRIKNFLAVLMAFALIVGMVPSLSITSKAAAPTTGSLTIKKTDQNGNPVKDAVYKIYKIANVTQDTTTAGQVTMKYNSTIAGLTVTGSTTAADLDGVTLPTESATITSTEDAAGVKVDDLALGVYLVKETQTPEGAIASNNFIVSIPMTDTNTSTSSITYNGETIAAGAQYWNYDVVATPKNNIFSGGLTKSITGGDTTDMGSNEYTANVGDTVDYTITATIPDDWYTNISGTTGTAKTYKQFDILDTPTAGLNIDTDSIKVYVGTASGTEITSDVNKTVGTPSNGFTIGLVKGAGTTASPYAACNAAITAGSTISVTYSATITKDAIGLTGGVKNDVKIKYDTVGSEGPGTVDPEDPNPNPDPDEPVVPVIYVGSYAALKVGEDSDASGLTGAKFVVECVNSEGTAPTTKYLKYTTTSGNTTVSYVDSKDDATKFTSGEASDFSTFTATGYFAIRGIKYSVANKISYSLVEVEAPTGYTLLQSPVTMTVDATSTGLEKEASVDKYSTKITDVKGFSLPASGGKGIFIYLGIGIVLVALGLLLFAKKRKMESK
ncbi:MAG: SpaH/EbpB family LPXTG-anchored major pilin [Lachnospiraceae bacterium]|jgi:fimbrial isopeptide formation D2 family protein/LPXTG-motif cell wall-anchored protein|nr:SpaH/EbpB family LPXTG-anchored major pilin [Lachnospiraceae bacterium]